MKKIKVVDLDYLMQKRNCKKDCSKCDFYTDGDTWCSGEVFVTTILNAPIYEIEVGDEVK